MNRLTGQSLKPRFEPARAGDVRSSARTSARRRKGAGLPLNVPWQEGLERTLEFYRGLTG